MPQVHGYYSVLHFDLEGASEQMESRLHEATGAIRAVPGGYTVDVSRAPDLGRHLGRLVELLSEIRELVGPISSAVLDVAGELDFRRLIVHCLQVEPGELQELGRMGVALEFSVYPVEWDESGEGTEGPEAARVVDDS